MSGFNVLDRNLKLSPCFLEASAGTGKTFAIETIVTRLLMRDEGLILPEILLVTFTTATASELKVRLRRRIEETLALLEKGEELPDYLWEIYEEGGERLILAKKRLARALSSFENAKIFTLHGFCLYALSSHASLHFLLEEITPNSTIDEITKDVLRTQTLFSDRELSLLFAHYKNELASLNRDVRRLVEKRVPISSYSNERELREEWQKRSLSLREKYQINPDDFLSELLSYAAEYKGGCNKNREVKSEVKESLSLFAKEFFSSSFSFQDSFLSEMRSANRLKRKVKNGEKYPGLLEEIQENLIPLYQEANDPLMILARLAITVQGKLEEKVARGELCYYQDLILKMREAVNNPSFVRSVREEFRALMIDEFQDIDQDLWKIFSTLFVSPDFSGPIYFIGDPKQSIYRFRGADLYSYEIAKKSFSAASQETLKVNFRSHPKLLKALNALFSLPDLFLLPQTQESLAVPALEAGKKREARFVDSRQHVHFLLGKSEEELFGAFALEVEHLHSLGIQLKECAVIVRDKKQLERFLCFAKEIGLPAYSRRLRPLTDSPAFFFLTDLLKASLFPKERPLMAKLFAWPNLWGVKEKESVMRLSEKLKEEGILPWFIAFMEEINPSFDEESCSDLNQIVEMMAEAHLSLTRYLPFLQRLSEEDEESERIRARALSLDAVQVMTIHASKGLEFEIVFPIGLNQEKPRRRELVFDAVSNKITLAQEALLRHQEEEQAEAMRLVYVAMTRAKERLYIPMIEGKERSPLAQFLQKSLQGKSLDAFVREKEELFSLSHCERRCEKITIKREAENSSIPFLAPKLSFTPHYQHSFSTLARPYLIHKKVRDNPSPPLPQELRGKVFGSFLHEIMEKMPWEAAIKAISISELDTLLLPFLTHSIYLPHHLIISELIFRALHTPLTSEDAFSLAEVHPKKICREMEFLYPQGDDFIKGFIDLFFEHRGKIYFVDWKTNDLGDNPDDYLPEKLEEVMQSHDYHLQATLYKEALRRYLSLFSPRLPIGGGFFLFLRGIDRHSRGIYALT